VHPRRVLHLWILKTTESTPWLMPCPSTMVSLRSGRVATGTQIIVSTERDATFTLDEILGNTTELPIVEHTTDSHGQTLATFALFDLVGLRLSPRIAKLVEKQLWRAHPMAQYRRCPRAGPLLRDHAQVDLIAEHWDDLLRVGGSLKRGHVSAALLIARLQAGSRQHPLAKAMLEYGKLLRTGLPVAVVQDSR
jgi:TnpA family transposase